MSFRIVHCADVHATAGGRVLQPIIDLFRRGILTAHAVVITGDLIQRGNLDAYADLAADLAQLGEYVPVVTTLGNHDDPEAARVLPGHETSHYRAVEVSDYTIVALDSTRFDEAQLAFLDQALSHCSNPVIAMHHPPFAAALPDLIRDNFVAPEDFARVVAGRARLILAGHYHQTGAGSIGGVGVWITPALSYQRHLALDHTGWSEHAETFGQFSVVDLTATGYQVGAVHLSGLTPVDAAQFASGHVERTP